MKTFLNICDVNTDETNNSWEMITSSVIPYICNGKERGGAITECDNQWALVDVGTSKGPRKANENKEYPTFVELDPRNSVKI